MIISIDNINIGKDLPFCLIAGPCVIENEKITLETAEAIKRITDKLNIPFVFKSSFKKANRTSIYSFVSIGIDESMRILEKVKNELNVAILTDVHSESDIETVFEFVDVLQIPAFLCRQTDLLVAAGKSNKAVNIKKGQFLAPDDMKHVISKVESTGNKRILLTERGTSFGYHNLIVDMRSLVIMSELGYPVVMDATHSVQMPSNSNITGGQPQFIYPLAKAAIAVGIDALFLEVHPNPKEALSDAGSQLELSKLGKILVELQKIDGVVKKYA